MGSTNFRFLKFERQHIKDAQSIFWKSFKYKVSEEFIYNKYNTSFLNTDSVSTIAYDQHTPVAFYGAIPQLFKNHETSFLMAHACDSYTIPTYQKKGLHYQLALKSYDLMHHQHIKMVYAFHSENTFHSTKKLQWKEHHHMIRFHIKTNRLPIAKGLLRLGLKKSISSKALAIFAPYIIEHYANPFSTSSLSHQNYDQLFFKYKESFNKHFLIEINHCVFYLKLNTMVNVGFFDFDTEQNLVIALEKLKELINRLGMNEILFQVDPSSKQYKVLSRIEKGLPSWLIGYLPFENNLDLDSFGFNFSDLDTF